MQQSEDLLPSIGDAGGRGRFLSNGARFYIDCGHHPEWSTAELANPWDAVRHVLAGERWLGRLAESVSEPGGRPAVSLFKTNVDPTTRVAWGCHESVLFEHTSAGQLTASLIPLLVTRVIYTGAGGFDAFAPGLEFVISPRAMFLQRVTSQESTWNRAIVHTQARAPVRPRLQALAPHLRGKPELRDRDVAQERDARAGRQPGRGRRGPRPGRPARLPG